MKKTVVVLLAALTIHPSAALADSFWNALSDGVAAWITVTTKLAVTDTKNVEASTYTENLKTEKYFQEQDRLLSPPSSILPECWKYEGENQKVRSACEQGANDRLANIPSQKEEAMRLLGTSELEIEAYKSGNREYAIKMKTPFPPK
jgi:hypothetical protein